MAKSKEIKEVQHVPKIDNVFYFHKGYFSMMPVPYAFKYCFEYIKKLLK